MAWGLWLPTANGPCDWKPLGGEGCSGEQGEIALPLLVSLLLPVCACPWAREADGCRCLCSGMPVTLGTNRREPVLQCCAVPGPLLPLPLHGARVLSSCKTPGCFLRVP